MKSRIFVLTYISHNAIVIE